MTTERYLVVNADDFGYSRGVNRGIIDAHERGIVTSASLMVRKPDAVDAGRYCHEGARTFGIGIHIDLGEWTCNDGEWSPLYQVVDLEDAEAVEREISAQLSTFRDLVGRNPTHIDSHQNIHLRDPAREVVIRYGRALGIPVRHFSSHVHYCGAFYGQTAEGDPLPEAVTAGALRVLLDKLPHGVTELGCHPGYGAGLSSVYASERDDEVRTLCDPVVRERVKSLGVTLASFDGLPAFGP